jgi:hypothetical protein
MVAQLMRPSRVERRSVDSINERFDGDRRGISQSYRNINLDRTNLKQSDVIAFLKKAKNIIGDDFKKRKQPSIPYIAISLALSKDILDYVQISGAGLLITIPVSVIASASLIYWAWGKTSFRAWKEKILRWFIISIIIELFPVSSFIPATLILVLIIHYNETKAIRLINLTLDYMKKGGVLQE